MATIIKSTLKASGGDYSSIKDWIDDMLLLYPNLVLLDVILELECYNDWPGGLDESFVDFKSGFTTDEDHFLRLITPTSERHTGVAGTGFWYNTSSTAFAMYSRNQHVVFDGLEMSAPDASQVMIGASANTIVKNCILHNIDSTGFSATTGAKFENCIVYLTAPSSTGNVGKAFSNATLDYITAYISPDSGAFSGDVIFQNCICNNVYMFHNHAKTSYDSFFGGSGDYNVGLAINGDLPGANSFYIADDSDLADPDNLDFRIKSTSPLATAGSGGGRIGAYYETGGGGETKEFIVNSSSSENLSNKISFVKSSSLSIGASSTENKTGIITFESGKEFALSGSLSGNYSNKIAFNKSSKLLLKGSVSSNLTNKISLTKSSELLLIGSLSNNLSDKISFVKSSIFIANGSLSDNYIDKVNFNKSSEFKLDSSVSGNLTGVVKFESDGSFVLKGSLSKNSSLPITFKKESTFNVGSSATKNKVGTVVFSGNKTREFIAGTSLSTNLTGTVTFLTSSFPDIGDNDVECESLSVNFIVESGAVMINAESQTTVYNCFSLSRQS